MRISKRHWDDYLYHHKQATFWLGQVRRKYKPLTRLSPDSCSARYIAHMKFAEMYLGMWREECKARREKRQ